MQNLNYKFLQYVACILINIHQFNIYILIAYYE